jgi:hypothetical protein
MYFGNIINMKSSENTCDTTVSVVMMFRSFAHTRLFLSHIFRPANSPSTLCHPPLNFYPIHIQNFSFFKLTLREFVYKIFTLRPPVFSVSLSSTNVLCVYGIIRIIARCRLFFHNESDDALSHSLSHSIAFATTKMFSI